MGRIFITGDTHGGYKSGSTKLKEFATKHRFSKDDYLIIAGDFGFIWEDTASQNEAEWLEWFDKQKFTTLFVDGNHENFNRLNSYKLSHLFGGAVHKISQKVIHLLRGEIYEINNFRIFTIGGALSIDKDRRTKNVSWWSDEGITQNQIHNAWENLRRFQYEVDIVISHTCPRKIAKKLFNGHNVAKIEDINMDILQGISEYIKFKKWYFGHFHRNIKINNKFTCLYENIEKVNLKSNADFISHEANLPSYIIEAIEKLYENPNFYYDFFDIVNEAYAKGDISENTSYRLRRRYLGMGI